MIIEPGIRRHPKFRDFKAIVGKESLELLVGLWEHCQLSQRGEFWANADSSYVEKVAEWDGQPGAFYQACLACRWIHEVPGGVVIHGWEEVNHFLMRNWTNGSRRSSSQAQAVGSGPQAKPTAGRMVGSGPQAVGSGPQAKPTNQPRTSSHRGDRGDRGDRPKGDPPLEPPSLKREMVATPGSRERQRMFVEQKDRIGFLRGQWRQFEKLTSLTDEQQKIKTEVSAELRKLLAKQRRGEL